ncbi:MAG: leucine-rich repeat protein, partial [Candidatus Methanomethylophilaceae archaeon]|nr:leucine-rich repeat protein [Candidatus Methanomethylophilaceae archaeon]
GPMELAARWLSAPCHAVTFTVSGGSVDAYVNGGSEPVPSGTMVPDGSYLRFVYIPDFGYEPLSWKVNGAEAQASGWTFEVPEATSDVRLYLEAAYHASGSSVVSVPFLAPTPHDYESAWIYGSGGDPNSMTFSNMVYAPSMIGDYIYCKNDNYLVKVDYGGNEVKRVKTADSFSGFYEYLAVGGGLILDGVTGKVFDTDLNNVFTISNTSIRAFYNDGYFYVSKASGTYCYVAEDERPDLLGNVQQPVWSANLGSAVTPYQGGTNMAFHNDFVMIVGMEDGGAVFLATYKYATGEPVDRLYIDEFHGRMVNIGYTTICEGYATLTVYDGGLFGSTAEDITNLASVRIMEDGRFDKVTLKTASSHTGGSYSSTMAVHDGLGYVFSDDRFQVYDMETMELLASAKESTFNAHGDMAIATGHPGKVYAYRASYANTTHIAVAEYDIASNKVTVGFLSGVAVQQYCSQQPRFLSDGSIVFVNDAGLLYCVKAVHDVSGISMDIPEADLDVGEEIRLGVVFEPANALNKGLTWSSSDVSVATVSDDGTVSAMGAGSAVITAVSDDGGFAATCEVFVHDLKEGSIIDQGGVRYGVTDLEGRKVTAIGHTESLEDLAIPAYVVEGGHAFMVEGIGPEAFAGCVGLSSVTIAEGVEFIQKAAFSGCSSLASVTFPETLELIGDNAFYKCSSLESVEFPESLERIGLKSFSYCSSIPSLNIACDVGGYAFFKCTELQTLRIEGDSIVIGKSAFSGCIGLTDVYLSDG